MLTADGARGGASPNSSGGQGAEMSGEIILTAGTELEIVVGGTGSSGGGDGGSFIYFLDATAPLLVAGGGGFADGGGGSFLAADFTDPSLNRNANPGDDRVTISLVSASVPEPSSLVLAGTALLAGLGCAWRRRSTRARS
jgi:PEP-CTERM motif